MKHTTITPKKIAVVGLGYVGLPLALLADKKGYSVIGIEKDHFEDSWEIAKALLVSENAIIKTGIASIDAGLFRGVENQTGSSRKRSSSLLGRG